jgi:antitoxin (DNA-binding transcriptional repressor) of toxin-antitoxin stability system
VNVLRITALVHDHRRVARRIKAGERFRVHRHGRPLFDVVPVPTAVPAFLTPAQLTELDRDLAQLAKAAQGRNLISEMRQENDEILR